MRASGEAASKAAGSSAYEVGQHLGRQEAVAHQGCAPDPADAGEVVDAVVGDRALDRGVRGLEPRLPRGVTRGQGREGAEVPAGGTPGDGEVARVAAVLSDVLAHPGDRLLHVDDVSGEGVARREPVVDGDADPALGGEVLHEGEALLVLLADGPPAAVHLEQHRGARGSSGRTVDVEKAPLAVVVVGDVALDHDPGAGIAEGVDQRAPRRGQLRRGRTGVESVLVVGAEGAAQGALRDAGALAALVDEEGEPGSARRAEGEADGVAGSRTAGQVARGIAHGEAEQVRGELAAEPPGREGQRADPETRERADGVGGERGGDELAASKTHAGNVGDGETRHA